MKNILMCLLMSISFVAFASQKPTDQVKKKEEHGLLTKILFHNQIEFQRAQEEALQELRNNLKDLDDITAELKQANEDARVIDQQLININNNVKSKLDRR